MEFRLLGRLAVEADGIELAPARPRERAVLAILLLRRGRVVATEELIDGLWGAHPTPTARTALHGNVSALRRRLGADRIETQPGGYRLRLLPGDAVDVDRFVAKVADAGVEAPLVRSELLREALQLFRGEPLEDVELAAGDGGALATEVAAERARLQELRLTAFEQRAAADLELGRHAELVPRLTHQVAEHPLREGLRAQLMLALYRTGRQADALAVAQDARRALAEELGVEPGPALRRLELQILDHDPALATMPGAPEQDGPGHVAPAPATDLPSGVLTFLALDRPEDPELEPVVEAQHAVAERHGGLAVPATGRIALFAFRRARDAAAAAAAMQRAARRGGQPPRIGLHAAAVAPVGVGYRGPGTDRAARVQSVAHPGQVVLSRTTRDLLREAPLDEVDVRDLGQHRLADLLPAEPLYQLVAAGLAVDFPPIRGLDALRTNLPVQPTPMLGREREVAEIVTLVRSSEGRLVTLTGPGGVGKTRLASHVAAELLDDTPDGVFLVPLEAVGAPELVASEIATTIGVREAGGGRLATTLQRELLGRKRLIVLDNFEHLLPAGSLVAELLAGAPEVRFLVTSRTPLKVEGEIVVAVPPLATPEAPRRAHPPSAGDIRDLLGVGSVALFIARAGAARPGFSITPENATAISGLCRTLEGLPLAIELAASRVALISPDALLDRLDEPLRVLRASSRPGPSRHRALQATIDWSHDLLDPAGRRLFADLAVFAGGWTLDAAERVCEDGLDIVDGLANLVDQSLVRLGGTETEPRFGMLVPIHEYAATKLDETAARPDLERRHAAFFLSLALDAEPHLRGNPGPWVARLEHEEDNLRAALDRLAARGEAELEARLAGALWRFWYLAGHLSEGRRRLEHALAAHPARTDARAKALIGAAVMAINTEDAAAARQRATEGLALHRSLADPWGAAYCEFMLGTAARFEDDDEAARNLLEDALAAFRVLGDEHTALLVSRTLAATLDDLGDREAARALYQDNLRRARADHNGRLEASTLGALASIAFDEGRVGDAIWMLRESLLLHRELGDRLDSALDLARAAQTLAMTGQADTAARLVAALAGVADHLGARRRSVVAMTDDTIASLRRRLSNAELDRTKENDATLDLDAALEIALDALG